MTYIRTDLKVRTAAARYRKWLEGTNIPDRKLSTILDLGNMDTLPYYVFTSDYLDHLGTFTGLPEDMCGWCHLSIAHTVDEHARHTKWAAGESVMLYT